MSKTLERDPEWISKAPVLIERRAEIQASPEAVWKELSVNETWVEWFPGFKACHFTSDAPHGLGSMRLVHQDNFHVHERITGWVPNERWAMTVVEINAPVIASMAEDVTLRPFGGGTHVVWQIGVELTRLGRLLKRPLVKKSSKGLETALADLAKRAERQKA